MSADNYVAVQRRDDTWHVWMVLGGYDETDWEPHGHWHKTFSDEIEAHRYAHEICANEVVEYGVNLLGPK